ncbi:MAG TPA: acetyl-CoA carboxylase biotin carboxyl carrier protein subunit [Chitinophaga sp.]
MIKATVNGGSPLSIQTGATVNCNENTVDWSAVGLPAGNYSILMDGRSYTAQVLNIDREAKMVTLEIDHQLYEVAIEEPIDQLLAAMGIKDALTHKVNDIKAPMPGLVLKVLVEPGQTIRKGDPVLVLEAMKMENVFKSAADAIVKAIKVAPGTAVEKGEVLIVLE